MKPGDEPQPPRCVLGRLQPNVPDAEETKRDAWLNLGILVVPISDARLGWVERESVRQLGELLYGRAR